MDEIRHNLNGKLSEASPLRDLLCLWCGLPLLEPLQTSCGCRICEDCYKRLCNGIERHISGTGGYECNRCKEIFYLEDKDTVFKDRAAENQIRSAQPLFPCYHEGCPWHGTNTQYRDHISFCQFARITCPNEGCNMKLVQGEMEDHAATCPAKPKPCTSCKDLVPFNTHPKHLFKDCTEFKLPCPFCPVSKPRRELEEHYQSCPWTIRCCDFREYGCTFKGTYFQLETHKQKNHSYRTQPNQLVSLQPTTTGTLLQHGNMLLWKIQEISRYVKQEEVMLLSPPFYGGKSSYKMSSVNIPRQGTHISLFFILMKGKNDHFIWPRKISLSLVDNTGNQVNTSILMPSLPFASFFQKPMEITGIGIYIPNFAPKSMLQDSQYVYNDTLTIAYAIDDDAIELSSTTIYPYFNILCLFSPQSDATLNGILLWKMEEFLQKRKDAIEEKMLFLDSPPFYTSSCGYKMCIRIYLNGDGPGKGTHLSVFFVLMKGPHDSLLPWPFNQKVTLQLINQSSGKAHYVYQFLPHQRGGFFRRPEQEMNVASGCPMFCRLEGLEKDDFVKDDTLYLLANVDTSGLYNAQTF